MIQSGNVLIVIIDGEKEMSEMSKIGKQTFFQGIMCWSKARSGLSFVNRRISNRVDSENMDAFFFAFHERKDVLHSIAKEFYKLGIKSEIILLDKYTTGKQVFLLETERHPDLTEDFETWYKDNGGLN